MVNCICRFVFFSLWVMSVDEQRGTMPHRLN